MTGYSVHLFLTNAFEYVASSFNALVVATSDKLSGCPEQLLYKKYAKILFYS